ncbi:MAG: CopG family transcriptional regulator [Candidatus Harrisonbacteria bacterium CG10_big_fil_rev_8_21_14_0_10_45_28]|uniref:CopG family transcriptional regulator n=1 Tax=Candidatus Harrisonbacteria bacterium CG10_big_fil_rev_8_21_14_0_10_45_28 TaxID=1974586 RepID=A0A2H0UNU9_9BACT|nr:MAG: CopG family transcriptional regulator [Candidatus Harrisonbacteria bacterium CG10_big_fil_rev_8_21_14_0_10_45_28]
MNKKILLGAGFIVAIILVVGVFSKEKDAGLMPVAQAHEATVYREATCGCCRAYLVYLKKEGFNVIDNVVDSIGAIKDEYGVHVDMQSCHTTIIDGYVVEGHMPIGAIEKLLSEKPAINGIALPGMPSGSPGMPGAKRGAFEIHGLMEESGQAQMMFMSL